MSQHRTLLRSASMVTGLTLVSRVFGYLRDQRLAALLPPVSADAYTMAFTIPNLLRRLVGEGAVSAAFIPIFSEYLSRKDREQAWAFANAMLTVVIIGMTVVTMLGILAAPLLVRLMAWGFADTPGKMELTTFLTRIMFPYIFLVSLSALAMGVLNSLHRFGAPSFAPVLLNLSIIAFSFLTDFFDDPTTALAVGVVVGGAAQVALQVPILARSGWRFRPRLDLAHPGVRRTGILLAPVVISSGVVQINVLVDKLFASFLGDGAQFSIYMSDRVMELVLGGYAIAIATVILPMLSKNAAEGQFDQMRESINFAARIILFITVPATVGLVVLRTPIIQVLYEHGEFDAAGTERTAWALLFYALGLSAFSMMKILAPAFYALKDTRTPVQVAFAAMFLNIAFNFAFFRPLGVGGPPLATSLAALFNVAVLTWIFSRRKGSLDLAGVGGSLARFLAASVPLAAAAFGVISWPGFYDGQPFLQQALALATAIAAAAAVYLLAARLLGCRELEEILGVFKTRGRRGSGPGPSGAAPGAI